MGSASTVSFNVGGKTYEISSFLLKSYPQTLMAKQASEATSSPIFIDRDPDRFAYCLDYMRDNGRVYLGDNVSKRSLLEELQILGFDNIDESLIQYDESSKKQTATRFQANVDQLLMELENMRKEIAKVAPLQRKVETGEVALQYLAKMMTTDIQSRGKKGMELSLHHSGVKDEAYFAECCERIGLKYYKDGYKHVVAVARSEMKKPAVKKSSQ